MAELSLNDLAALVGGELVSGDGSLVVTGVSSLEEAGPSEVSFLGNKKYFRQFASTGAGAILIPKQLEAERAPDGAALVEVENPSMAFSSVIAHFAEQEVTFEPGIEPGAHVSPEASVDPATVRVAAGAVVESGAVVGRGTEICSGVVIGRGVTIGEDCLIYPNVTIRERCQVGNRVVIQPGAVIGSDGYGYELVEGRHCKIPQVGIVVLGDDVEIGANTTIDRARFGKTIIGEGTKIDNLVQVAHNVVIGKHCLLVAMSGIAGSSKLGNYVTMAAQSGVSGHLELGDQILLGGQSGVSKSLLEPGPYLGSPARPMQQEMKARAAVARLPKLLEEIRHMRKRVAELEQQSGLSE